MSGTGAPPVVIGVGNLLLGDDAAGLRVVGALRRLAAAEPGILPAGGRLIDQRAATSPAVRLPADLAALVAARRSLNDAFAAAGGPGGDR